MIAVIDAQLAWCPPTFSPSALSRMWFAWWIVQADSQRRRSSRIFRASMSVVTGFSIGRAYSRAAVTGRSGVGHAAELVDRLEHGGNRLALAIAQLGSPDVEDQHDPHLAGRVP